MSYALHAVQAHATAAETMAAGMLTRRSCRRAATVGLRGSHEWREGDATAGSNSGTAVAAGTNPGAAAIDLVASSLDDY
jgi:hypothetical protein